MGLGSSQEISQEAQASISRSSSHIPLSLYIHIPWCIKKCPYCDFNSHKFDTKKLPEDAYIKALINDLILSLPLINNRIIQTIFIGGGTPSLFSGESINSLLNSVRSLLSVSPFAEITMECNPGTIDIQYLKEYRDAGVNRISIGCQSFNDRHLKILGRMHIKNDTIRAINLAQKYFDNINLDLMYGLPSQTMLELEEDLNIALQFNTNHLSIYNLTIEQNTLFYKKPPQNLPDNDQCYSMQDKILEILTMHNYGRYEVSAYAKNNTTRCRHNLNYWQFGDYLGIGAGAHSKITLSDNINNTIIRQVKEKHPTTYLTSLQNIDHNIMQNIDIDYVKHFAHIVEHKIISKDALPFEFMLNSLRLIDGFENSLFTNRTFLSLNTVLTQLLKAEQKGFINLSTKNIVPTKLGIDFLNEVLLLFL